MPKIQIDFKNLTIEIISFSFVLCKEKWFLRLLLKDYRFRYITLNCKSISTRNIFNLHILHPFFHVFLAANFKNLPIEILSELRIV